MVKKIASIHYKINLLSLFGGIEIYHIAKDFLKICEVFYVISENHIMTYMLAIYPTT